MKELTEGVVIEVTEHTAKVRASIHGDCDHCGMCPGSNAMILDVVNEAGAAVGDHVFIENRTMNGVLAAFIIFLLPILAVILGIVLGYYLSFRFMLSAKLLMISGGSLFGLTAFIFIRRIDKSLQSEKPTIVKIERNN
jgi:sigma-E factor negative regulatory protein RseC